MKIIISTLLTLFITQLGAVSFNCSKASSYSEKVICRNAKLSQLDDELAVIYAKAKRLTGNNRDFKKHSYAEWKWREDNCHTINCLVAWYNKRKADLRIVVNNRGQRNGSVNKARLARAASEHVEHASRVASNQKEFAEKMIGIRAKSDLAPADGNINDIKIQYYIPGSEEVGEMWIDWHIDDEKGPMMRLHFMDPTHKYKTEAHKIDISLEPIKEACNTDINIKSDDKTSPSCTIIKDILIADKWAKIAKKAEMKRRYRKMVSYIEGSSNSKKSLAVYFQVYEDGAMTAQLEEMNHGFPERFNFTFAQALELSKYIENTRKKAHKKWMNKTRTKEDLDAMFK